MIELEFLVDNILIHLRKAGILSGPLYPERVFPEEEKSHVWHAPREGAGYLIRTAIEGARKPRRLVPTQPGSIVFYEQVRPIFEEAYDAIGLHPIQAVKLDNSLYFKCAARGPGPATIENFLNYCERQGQEYAIASLESIMEITNTEEDEMVVEPLPVVPLDERAKRLAESWGLPAKRTVVDTTKPVVLPRVETYHTELCHIMECDRCGGKEKILYRASKQELCNRCLALWNNRPRGAKVYCNKPGVAIYI